MSRFCLVFSKNNGSAGKRKSAENPHKHWIFSTLLAERMGFEPMCDCSQTDFEILFEPTKNGQFQAV